MDKIVGGLLIVFAVVQSVLHLRNPSPPKSGTLNSHLNIRFIIGCIILALVGVLTIVGVFDWFDNSD
jgi:hypothetical protein